MTKLYKVSGNDTRAKKYRLIKNSEVIKVGDFITNESAGMANVDAVTEKVAGFATAIVTADKKSLESATVDTGALGGTWASSTKQYTAAADNQTVDGVMVEYIELQEDDEIVATLDAAKGTTTGSNIAGYYIAALTSDSSKLDESTASATATNTQFETVDPLLGGSTTEVVVRVRTREANL